jgi:hypothetical protein
MPQNYGHVNVRYSIFRCGEKIETRLEIRKEERRKEEGKKGLLGIDAV